MKRAVSFVLVAVLCGGIGSAVYQAAGPAQLPLSKYVPAGPSLYLEAKDFSSLLADWNASSEKKHWLSSTDYEVFSRSRLFLRLKGASDQFAVAAGLPPDMNFLLQVAGDRSALALYDIGKLQFLYITHLPSARSIQTQLWQTRANFESRSAGGVSFYFRRDPESQREVAFAIANDYLLLATREDLLAGALQLMAGAKDRKTIETEQWWGETISAAAHAGDLRMLLDLQRITHDGYFRTYWIQQNITDLSQYSAAVSDLFRVGKQYREERVLVRGGEPKSMPSPEALAATADVVRLVPENAGTYQAVAAPTAGFCFGLLQAKLLASHSGAAPASETAPQVRSASGQPGVGADLETRIDQSPVERSTTQAKSALQELLEKTQIQSVLSVQSTELDKGGVFVRMHSAIVLVAASDWNESAAEAALAEFVRPSMTASTLGFGWQPQRGYRNLDGLWSLVVSVNGKYLLIGDDPGLIEAMLVNFRRPRDRQPAEFYGAFNHDRERTSFTRFVEVIDRPNVTIAGENSEPEPQFFSGNMASLSATLSSLASESIVVRSEGNKVRQTVTYEWSR